MTTSTTLMEIFAGQAGQAVRSVHFDCEGNIEVVTQTPIQKPLGKITSAVEYLKRFRLDLSCKSAFSYLTCIVEGVNFNELYQHYFPAEFANSSTSLFPVIGSRNFSEGAGVFSAREAEFFNLVNDHLFPIDLDAILNEAWDEGIRPDMIPLEYWGHGFEIDDPNFSGSRLGWQAIASIFFYEVITNAEENAPYLKALGKLDKDFNINFKLLTDLCNAEGEPVQLEDLPHAIEVIYHSTGNVFIDCDDMYPAEDLYWSDGQSTIDRLADDHVRAHEILDKCELLMDWIEASPKNFRKVIDLCNQSNSKRQEQARVRV